MTDNDDLTLTFVTCVSDPQILRERLLASPCLSDGEYPLVAYFNASSAAQGFNATQRGLGAQSWLVWVHQDVYLPRGWPERFKQALQAAHLRFPQLAVAGVYGVAGAGATARRAGHVLDRGGLLREATPLPCLIDSLDELLFAVRCASGLKLDPQLAWDFYATDLVLQAQVEGWQCAVVDAFCEHWSETAASGATPQSVVNRINASATAFEQKWLQRLPITTPCFEINCPGDVAAFIEATAVVAR